jgi:hypothetical protein
MRQRGLPPPWRGVLVLLLLGLLLEPCPAASPDACCLGWDEAKVRLWVMSEGLEAHDLVAVLEKRRVNGEALLSLDDRELKDYGVR